MSDFTQEREQLLDDLQSLSGDDGNVKEASAGTSSDLDDVEDICAELQRLEKKARQGEIAQSEETPNENVPSGEEAAEDGVKDGVPSGEEAAEDGVRDGIPSGQEKNNDEVHDEPELQETTESGHDGAPSGTADGAEGEQKSPDKNVEGMPSKEVPQDANNQGGKEHDENPSGESKKAMDKKHCPKCGEKVEPNEDGKCPHCNSDLSEKDKTAGDKEDLPEELREQAEEAEEEGGVEEANESDESDEDDEEDDEKEDKEDSEDKEASLSPEAQGLETDVIESNLESMVAEGFSQEATQRFTEKVADFRDTEETEVPSLSDEPKSTQEENGFLQRL